MRRVWLAMLIALLPGEVRADDQTVIGPAPGLTTEMRTLFPVDGSGRTGYSQTFLAVSPFFLGVSFWWSPSYSAAGLVTFATELRVTTGAGQTLGDPSSVLYKTTLDNHIAGWYSVAFDEAIAVTPGQQYALTFRSDYCLIGNDCTGDPTGGTLPRLLFTTSDWYGGGVARDNYFDPASVPSPSVQVHELPGDLVMALYFGDSPNTPVTFVTEPAGLALVAVAVPLGLLAGYRRRKA